MNNEFPMLDLYQQEVEVHGQVLNDGILALEADKTVDMEALMRAAHSLKGAARILELANVESIAHLMEDIFMKLKNNEMQTNDINYETLLKSTDYLNKSGRKTAEELSEWLKTSTQEAEKLSEDLKTQPSPNKKKIVKEKNPQPPTLDSNKPVAKENYSRVSIEQLNKFMGMITENLTYSHQLEPFQEKLKNLKKQQIQIIKLIDSNPHQSEAIKKQTHHLLQEIHQQIETFETILKQNIHLSNRLHQSILKLRMRPLKDGILGFSRMVRDLGTKLNKRIEFNIQGGQTPVDRDILSKLESPLTHIIRNACDHGIECPEVRKQLGKPEVGTITLFAYHEKGMLVIEIKDDGQGIDLEKIRKKIKKNKQLDTKSIKNLTEEELLEFIFLPNFSTQETVSEISGRGVGLDVVQTFMQEIGGTIQLKSEYSKGSAFKLKAPITRSILKILMIKINDELYAIPLSQIKYVKKINSNEIFRVENRQYFKEKSSNIGLISSKELLGYPEEVSNKQPLSVILLEDEKHTYGLVIDALVGEETIIVRSIEKTVGKIPLINGVTTSKEGNTILILDSKDIITAANKLFEENNTLSSPSQGINQKSKGRILVIDDSITVRETEKQLLENEGYEVQVAVDGIDGWNTLQLKTFDLLVSDIDMPRLNGYGLVQRIRKNKKFDNLPIIIISYKDRPEDIEKGLKAGANRYLTKSCLKDNSFIKNIEKLIKK